jgi:hypothetical protein
MLFVPCILLQLIHQPNDAPNKMLYMTNINLLHVSTSGFHPQGFFQIKGIQAQHVNLVTESPSFE